MLKMPYNPIAHSKSKVCEYRIKYAVKWYDRSPFNIVSDLPADTALPTQCPYAFTNYERLLIDVFIEMKALFILFTDVVRGRGDNQIGTFIRESAKQIETVATKQCDIIFR